MSKDEKKAPSSPASTGGMPAFDPAHLLGLHSLAAAGGLPFPPLAPHPLSNPYSLLGQPGAAAAFPGLFPGLGAPLGGLPNPLHAAALQHSLAAASYYGLPKLPGEMGSPPPTSSPHPSSSSTPPSASALKGRSSRSSSSKRTSPSPSPSHRHQTSRSSSSPSVAATLSSSPAASTPSSTSSSIHPALVSPYHPLLPPTWGAMNGAGLGGSPAGFPFGYPGALGADPKLLAEAASLSVPSSSSSSSRRGRKPGTSNMASSDGKGDIDFRTSSHSGDRLREKDRDRERDRDRDRERIRDREKDRNGGGSGSRSQGSSSSHQSPFSSAAFLSVPSAHQRHHQSSTPSMSSTSTASSSSSRKTSSPKSSPAPSKESVHQSVLQQQQQAAEAAAVAAAAAYGGLDPRGLMNPYHMSPELLYLSYLQQQHRPDLAHLQSPFLAAAAAAASSSSSAISTSASTKSTAVTTASSSSRVSAHLSSSSSSTSSSAMNLSLEPGQISRSMEKDKNRGERRKRESHSPEHSSSELSHYNKHMSPAHSFPTNGVGATETLDERLLVDLSTAHSMDDHRRKKIAESIRRRFAGGEDGGRDELSQDSDVRRRDGSVGRNSVAALLSRHGIKHSDWAATSDEGGDRSEKNSKASPSHNNHAYMADGHGERKRRVRDNYGSQSSQDGRKSRELEISDKIRLEAELERQEEQLRELQKRYLASSQVPGLETMQGQDLSQSSGDMEGPTHQRSRSRLDTVSSYSDDQNMDMDGQNLSGSESGKSSPDASRMGDDSNPEDGSPKKKPLQIDERELTIPLEHGWNRQTIINGMGRRGIVGEVLYFAPCGKKLKTIPDVMRYLERNPNPDLGRENFSFNTKANVGQFFEVRNGQGSTPVPLSDTEILEKIEMSRGKRARMQMLARRKREKAAREQALARQVMENKLKRRMELQVIEKKKEKEQKMQEKIRQQEELRREREARAQQIIEARNRRQKELEEMRIAEAAQKTKEREMKRQQLIIMKEQERERRRQQLLVIKVLEHRKRLEEKQNKERAREEKLHEKLKQREARINHRKVEMEVAAELKKPVDDLELKVSKPLPKFPRMKTRLAGKAVADCLMVVEFLKNFGPALNLDKSSTPTVESLERGMLNDNEDDVEELTSLFMHLLRVAIDDVGVPSPKEATTKLNQKVTEMEMTDSTMSEILRIFVGARGEKEMSEWLKDKPLEALNPTCKAAILGFLCNELLSSKSISNEIDKHMEAINNLRRDKWIVEGQLRQLRVFQARKFNKIHRLSDRRLNEIAANANSGASPTLSSSGNVSGTLSNSNSNTNLSALGDEDTMSSSKMGSDDDEDDEKEMGEEGSGNDSDGGTNLTSPIAINSALHIEPVDESLSMEESDKRLEKLRKQHAAYRQKVFRASLRLRAINIGQDRYRRTFWVLPLTGGVYVEGMESGSPEHYKAAQEVKPVVEVKTEEVEQPQDGEGVKVKEELESDSEETSKIVDDEEMIDKSVENVSTKSVMEDEDASDRTESMIGVEDESKAENPPAEIRHTSSECLQGSEQSVLKSPNQCNEEGKSGETVKDPVVSSVEDCEMKEDLDTAQSDKICISEARQEEGDNLQVSVKNGSGEQQLNDSIASDNKEDAEEKMDICDRHNDAVSGNMAAEDTEMDFNTMDDEDDGDCDAELEEEEDKEKEKDELCKDKPRLCNGYEEPIVKSNQTVNHALDKNPDFTPEINGELSTSQYPPSDNRLCVTVSLCSDKRDSPVIESDNKSEGGDKRVEPSAFAQTDLESTSISLDEDCLSAPSSSDRLGPLTVAVSLADPNNDGPTTLVRSESSPLDGAHAQSAKGVVVDLEALSSDAQSNAKDGSNGMMFNGCLSGEEGNLLTRHSSLLSPSRADLHQKKTLQVAPNSISPKESGPMTESNGSVDKNVSNKELSTGVEEKENKSETETDKLTKTSNKNETEPVATQDKSNESKPISVNKETGAESDKNSSMPAQSSGSDPDILKIPQLPAAAPAGETLVSLLNYSIQQAYLEEEKEAEREKHQNIKSSINNGQEIHSLENLEETNDSKEQNSSLALQLTKSKPSGTSEVQPSRSSLLSSTLLFSAIPKPPQGSIADVATSSKTDSSISNLSNSTSDITPNPVKSSGGKSRNDRSNKGSTNHSSGPGLVSRPIPAHTKPVNPQPLPPFHPSAQSNPLKGLEPPAAHTSSKCKSTLPPSLLTFDTPLSHHHHHHYHNHNYPPPTGFPSPHNFGPTSASETLYSLASIVSPPPAHQQQPHRPRLDLAPTTTTPTITTPLPTPVSSSTPKSSRDSQYTSSELLQQAASQARKAVEGKKLSPTLMSHMAATTPSSEGTKSSSHHSASSSPSKEDFLAAYTVPPSLASASSPSKGAVSLSQQQHQTDSRASRPTTPLSAQSATSSLPSSSSAEVVDHNLWFSILPRAPCDEHSITTPSSIQDIYATSIPAGGSSPSLSTSALSSALINNGSSTTGAPGLNTTAIDSLLPLLQANPSLLSHEVLLQLLQSPTSSGSSPVGSGRQSPCGGQSLDSSGDFKVPPPRAMTPLPDPWDVLRAAQGEPQPIPKNCQHGWWQIRDIAQLRAVMPATLERGIREKALQRGIHRYVDYAKLHCSYDSDKGQPDPEAVADSSEPPAKKAKKTVSNEECKSEEFDGGAQSIKKGALNPSDSPDRKEDSNQGGDLQGMESEDSNPPSQCLRSTRQSRSQLKSEDASMDSDVKEDKCREDSMKEEEEEGKEQEGGGGGRISAKQEDGEEEVDDFVTPDGEDSWSIKVTHEIELAALEEVEALEERIFHASLQAKQGWRPTKDENLVLVDRSVTETKDYESYPLDVGISRLLELEANIERRYLKPPLIKSGQLSMSSLNTSGDGDFEDEDVPPGLLLWRQAVVGSESPAQLNLCTQLLAKSISWEKSIMRVICQNCRKDDNEDQLLLCDGCDKGYHTYCFKPKMENIPDGDWFCFECVSKASGTPHCGVCGAKGGKMVACNSCPRSVHLECLEPPLPRMPKRWQCINCLAEKGPKRSKKRKESLPTVQRITVTKLVVKEEPTDPEVDIQMDTIAATAAAAGAAYDSSPSASPSSSPLPTAKPGSADGGKKSSGGKSGSTSRAKTDSGGASKPTTPRKRDRKKKGKDANEEKDPEAADEPSPPKKASYAALPESQSSVCIISDTSAAGTDKPPITLKIKTPRKETTSRKSRKEKRNSQASPLPSLVVSNPAEASMDSAEEEDREDKVADEENGEDSPLEERRVEKGNAKDFVVCGKLLTELEKHEHGWPFLKPVNRKQFPSYKKYIKFPMDFSTSRGKLKNKEYRHRQEFAADMRLIFNNCETFNEDESEVGQCGFELRAYFERRWLELFPDDALQ